MLFNVIFFCGVVFVSFVAGFVLPPPLYSGSVPIFQVIFGGNFVLAFFYVFLTNLTLSAIIFVTLPGFVFFPLSPILLAFRAYLWGLLILHVPTEFLLVILPILVFEGEAYVLAALAGTVVGVAWAKPHWFDDRNIAGRTESLKKSLKECVGVYSYVALLLLMAAIMESATLAVIS